MRSRSVSLFVVVLFSSSLWASGYSVGSANTTVSASYEGNAAYGTASSVGQHSQAVGEASSTSTGSSVSVQAESHSRSPGTHRPHHHPRPNPCFPVGHSTVGLCLGVRLHLGGLHHLMLHNRLHMHRHLLHRYH